MTIESSIVALVDALVTEKGWMHTYANAVVRGAVDREAYVPLNREQVRGIFERQCWVRARASDGAELIFFDVATFGDVVSAIEAAVLTKVKP